MIPSLLYLIIIKLGYLTTQYNSEIFNISLKKIFLDNFCVIFCSHNATTTEIASPTGGVVTTSVITRMFARRSYLWQQALPAQGPNHESNKN